MQILKLILQILKVGRIGVVRISSLVSLAIHPGGHGLSHALFEGGAEGAVAPEAALVGQLLGGESALVSDGFTVEVDEVIDAQAVDVSVVGQALLGEILAEVIVVGANGLSKLGKREVVL